MKVAVAAVVNMPPTLRLRTAALSHSHCKCPRGQENGNNVVTGPGARRKPYRQHEAEMGEQRETKGDGRALYHTPPFDCSPLRVAGCLDGV